MASAKVSVQGGFGGVGGAEPEALGDFFDGQGGFVAELGSDGDYRGC